MSRCDAELRARILALLRALDGTPATSCELAAAVGITACEATKELTSLLRQRAASMKVMSGRCMWSAANN